MYKQRSPGEIQTPTRSNLFHCSMSAAPPMLSPSIILPPAPSHCTFIPLRKKFGAHLKNVVFPFFFNFLKIWPSPRFFNLKLCKFGSIHTLELKMESY